MFNKYHPALLNILLFAGLASGCKPSANAPESASNPGSGAGNYFKTPFQEESQFIVEAIVSDLAEQMFYAKFHRLPDEKYFFVRAKEKSGSPHDAPVYALQVRLDSKPAELTMEVNIDGPIWSPEVYEKVAQTLAGAVGLSAGAPGVAQKTELLSKLTDSAAETIEVENQKLSAALETEFTNGSLHAEAALLLGAFTLREHSGHFYEIRSPLSRITAHLVMAHFLGEADEGADGKMARAILLTLIGDEAPALKQLQTFGTNDPATFAFVRALQARNTGDYRPLESATDISRIESVAWFSTMSDYIGATMAWPKLNEEQKRTVDFTRIAFEQTYSVEMGHELMTAALPLEMQEIREVYELSQKKKLPSDGLVEALNQLPERCFTRTAGAVQVRVIGWGQWAAFLQRHLCHAAQQDFYFMNYMWGVPEDAKELAANCAKKFGGLRLYPFVRLFMATDEKTYHQAVDDGFKVTVASPQYVPADCWNNLCFPVYFAPPYNPNPNPHINEWHNHNPPPGTVYNLGPRLHHPSLTDRRDAMAFFYRLHELAPYDCRVKRLILKKKYDDKPTFDQAKELYSDLLSYSITALQTVANAAYDQPARYEELMLQAAKLNPANYYALGNYADYHTNEDQAAQYYEQACALDNDSVRISNIALWRVRHYLKKGEMEKARQIADDGAEVYSSMGLQSKAVFFELTSNYDEAFNWFAKNEERYNAPDPLVEFCLRYKNQTGDNRFDAEAQSRLGKIFTNGVEKVSLKDFKSPPTDGVVIMQENQLVTGAGLKKGDVIVAVYGVRVHNFHEYSFGRSFKNTPELDLIVWQGDAYREFTPAPPNHLFKADFGDYPPKPR